MTKHYRPGSYIHFSHPQSSTSSNHFWHLQQKLVFLPKTETKIANSNILFQIFNWNQWTSINLHQNHQVLFSRFTFITHPLPWAFHFCARVGVPGFPGVPVGENLGPKSGGPWTLEMLLSSRFRTATWSIEVTANFRGMSGMYRTVFFDRKSSLTIWEHL